MEFDEPAGLVVAGGFQVELSPAGCLEAAVVTVAFGPLGGWYAAAIPDIHPWWTVDATSTAARLQATDGGVRRTPRVT